MAPASLMITPNDHLKGDIYVILPQFHIIATGENMKRLPSGFGSVSKMTDSKHRYKPWRAVLSAGKEVDEEGHVRRVRKTLGVFKTRTEAIEALTKYHETPYNIDASHTTFKEVYEKWRPSCENTDIKAIEVSYRHFAPLYNKVFSELRTADYEAVMAKYSANAQKKMRSLASNLYKYALRYDLAEKNYAGQAECSKIETKRDRVPFTNDEVRILWNHVGESVYIDFLLVSIYSGWRTMEAATCEMDLKEKVMRGGSKTEAGKNRVVPIHSKILKICERYPNGFGLTYAMIKKQVPRIFKELKMDHIPYETRHTFITGMKTAGADEYAIKVIVGHATTDITEHYTHRDIEQLRTEIEKLSYD